MKKLTTLALLATAAIATPAMAQTTGTVLVEGTVSNKCAVTTPASSAINVGELAQADGTVVTAFASSDLTRTMTVKCTGANVKVEISSGPLHNQTPVSGYTNDVNYTSTLTVSKASGGTTTPVAYTSPAATAASVDNFGPLATSSDNVSVTISAPTASGTLGAGSYKSTISVVFTPHV